jgi:hypothetical protein
LKTKNPIYSSIKIDVIKVHILGINTLFYKPTKSESSIVEKETIFLG